MVRRQIRSVGFAIVVLCYAPLCFGAGAGKPHVFFDRKPYVPPKIIQDLAAWESDNGDQVVAINLLDSIGSNRYFGDIKVQDRGAHFVYTDESAQCTDDRCRANPPSFGYRLIGKTPSGIYVLFTESSGGGSGKFRGLMFVSFKKDHGLSAYANGKKALRLDRTRWLIWKLGELPLGDRYEGDISLQGNTLHIAADEHEPSAGIFKKDTVIKLEAGR